MTEPERERPRLVRRVALMSAAAAAIGGALASSIAGVLAGQLVTAHEDQQVLELTAELASEVRDELDEEEDDDDDGDRESASRSSLDLVLAHELEDIKRPLASAAIVAGEDRLAGDPSLPLVEPGHCTSKLDASAARRVCASWFDDDRLILLSVSAEQEHERRMLMGWALICGALFGAGIGGAISHRSATWTLSPLIELRDRVRKIDAQAPESATLEPPAHHAEVEEVRAAIVSLVDRLGASLAHAQAFAANAAHELRTPLAVLAGELQLMLEADDHSRAELESLDRLHNLVQNLITLTQRLLILAGSNQLHAERGEPVDLSDVLEAVCLGMSADGRARLRMQVEDDVIVRGDFELLSSLLHNAIDNAMKFSSGAVEVRISGGDLVRIDVIDDGPGIDSNEREQVFRPFFRGARPTTVEAPGHGIGLALIAHVAEVHGGRAAFVESNKGAHLQVTLPRWSA